jgi:N utilization substance protein B
MKGSGQSRGSGHSKSSGQLKSLKQQVIREVTLWNLFALDTGGHLSQLFAPVELRATVEMSTHPLTRSGAQLVVWQNDEQLPRITFSHIKNKSRLLKVWADPEVWEKVNLINEQLMRYQSAIDLMISRSSLRWKLPRMGGMDRAILRLATYELCFELDLPAKTILNDAIELGKRFGDMDSGRFINGVLDRIAQDLGRIQKRDNKEGGVSVQRRS